MPVISAMRRWSVLLDWDIDDKNGFYVCAGPNRKFSLGFEAWNFPEMFIFGRQHTECEFFREITAFTVVCVFWKKQRCIYFYHHFPLQYISFPAIWWLKWLITTSFGEGLCFGLVESFLEIVELLIESVWGSMMSIFNECNCARVIYLWGVSGEHHHHLKSRVVCQPVPLNKNKPPHTQTLPCGKCVWLCAAATTNISLSISPLCQMCLCHKNAHACVCVCGCAYKANSRTGDIARACLNTNYVVLRNGFWCYIETPPPRRSFEANFGQQVEARKRIGHYTTSTTWESRQRERPSAYITVPSHPS